MSNSILRTIVTHKKNELKVLKKQYSDTHLDELIEQQTPCRGFADSLSVRVRAQQLAIIAECKKASPSQGTIRENYDPAEIAKAYENAGACCISVLTDEHFFHGSVDHLTQVKKNCNVPIIRKDFIIDPHQIYHSRAIGADCILLIVAALGKQQLNELYHCAQELNIDVVVETHDLSEIEEANRLSANLVGINNRNLNTFEVDLQTTLQGKNLVHSEAIIITESGIKNRQNVKHMCEHEIFAFLVGETFMRHPSPGEALKQLFF